MKNPLSTPVTRLNQILLTAAIRAEGLNAERAAEQRRREHAQRLDQEAEQ